MVLQSATPAIMSKEVLYIGSAVPLETSEGLEAVQQPLRSRYPLDSDQNVQGILSTLSILPSGIELRYKDDSSHVVLFPFSALTMCAAVRCVRTIRKDTNEMSARFVSLSSPEAGGPNSQQPAIFTMIMRRTKGRQVLECHGFITMSPKDALDLVQCTASLDKRSKHGTLDTLATRINSSSHDISKGDNSFYEESSSLPDVSIQLVPGEPIMQNTASAFYKEPPTDGYFYSTRQELVKKYSLHKFTGAAGADTTLSGIPPGADHFEKRSGYATSHFSAKSAMYSPQPRHPVLVPIRPYYPQPVPSFGRPMFAGPTPAPMLMYPRPHFFSPPPAGRVRPVPVFVLPPGPSMNDSHARIHVGRNGSSRSSSATSIPDSPRFSSRSQRKTHQTNIHDYSIESTSRPRTPPTDYDAPRAPRMSRREDFYHHHHNLTRDLPMPPRPMGGGYYMLPSYGYNSLPPAVHLDRASSVPPYVERFSTKTKKTKKSKTKKKEKKEKKEKNEKKMASNKGSHDESTDSVGYLSGSNVDSKQPRDFRRVENQFKHERAFSQSLAEETRHTVKGGDPFNAYSLNNTQEHNENEFPPAMY